MKKTNSIRITNPTRFFSIIAGIIGTLIIVIVFMNMNAISTERESKLFLVKQDILEWLGETEMSYEEIANSRISYHDSEDWYKKFTVRCTFSYTGRSIEIPEMFWNDIERAIDSEIYFDEFESTI